MPFHLVPPYILLQLRTEASLDSGADKANLWPRLQAYGQIYMSYGFSSEGVYDAKKIESHALREIRGAIAQETEAFIYLVNHRQQKRGSGFPEPL